MPTAIVAGVLAGKPGNGGNAWSRLSLVEGLRRLGLDVIFIEQLADPTPQATAYFEAIRNEFGLDGHLEWNGRLMGQKAHEFRKFADLPRQTAHPFEIALDIDPADSQDRELMDRNGWRIVDPREAAGSPDAFRRYVQGSGAEFSVAQGIYVETACGWFSDRTTRYLASGKPALVQDTGFSRNLPAGEGLIAFATMEQAVAGANAIWRDYRHHSQAARALAEEHFDSDRVLGRLLERAGL